MCNGNVLEILPRVMQEECQLGELHMEGLDRNIYEEQPSDHVFMRGISLSCRILTNPSHSDRWFGRYSISIIARISPTPPRAC